MIQVNNAIKPDIVIGNGNFIQFCAALSVNKRPQAIMIAKAGLILPLR